MKKKMNRIIISIALAAALLMTVMLTTASGKVLFPLPENPTPAQIKATYYLNSDMFAEYAYVAYEAPYKKYIEEIESDDTFEAEYLLWKADNLIECVLDGNTEGALYSELGYYETVVFDVFYEAVNNGSYVEDFDAMIKSTGASAGSDIRTAIYTLGFENEPEETEELTAGEMDQILSRLYYLGGSYYDMMFESEENFKEAMSSANTIKKMTERLSTLLSFMNIGESRAEVLDEMYEQCDNKSLKLALADMKGYYDSNFNITYVLTHELLYSSLNKLLKEVYGSIWGDMVKGLGGGYAGLLYSVGKKAVNAWFSTDKYCEAYHEMRALAELEELLAEVSHNANGAYDRNPSNANAEFYNSCMEVTMNVYELGYEYSEDYLELLDDMGINHVAIALGKPGLDHSELVNEYKVQRTNMERQYVIAEAMLDEICAQNEEGYEAAYDEPFELQGQADFDVLCDISIELEEIIPEYDTKLYTSCDEDIVATRACNIGAIDFGILTVSDCKLGVSGEAKGKLLYLDKGQLEVGGDLSLISVSEMNSEEDLLHVKGDFTVGNNTYNTHYESEMTAGTIELEGDLTFKDLLGNDSYATDGYNPTGTCKTVFCGNDLQTVRGSVHRDNNGITLGAVKIQNPQFTMEDGAYYDESYRPNMKLVADSVIEYKGDIKVNNLDLNGYELTTVGAVDITNKLSSAGGDAGLGAAGGSKVGEEIVVTGNKTSMSGNVTGKLLYLDKGQLEVDGDLSLYSVSEMKSEEDLLHVKGDFTVGNNTYNTHYESEMTAGTIELEGDLTFKDLLGNDSYATDGYNPTGTCKTVFCGSELQTVKGKIGDNNSDLTLGAVEIQNPKFTMEYSSTSNRPNMKLVSDAVIDYEGNIKVKNLDLNGHSLKTEGTVDIANDLSSTRGDVGLGAKGGIKVGSDIFVTGNKTSISGDVTGKCLYMDKGQLEVDGDLSLYSVKQMKSEENLLHVKGDFTVGNNTYNTHYESEMTAGTIELEGDLTFKDLLGNDSYATDGYNPTGTCKTVFCGTGLQTVKGSAGYDNGGIRLGEVRIQTSRFTMEYPSASVRPNMKLGSDAVIDHGGNIQVNNLDLNGYSLTTVGAVDITNNLRSTGGDAGLGAEGGIKARCLYMDGGQMEIDGDLSLYSVKQMKSEEDLLHVKGDFTVGNNTYNTHYESEMTAGTIELEGDLTFKDLLGNDSYATDGYNPTGTCKTVFCGSEPQIVEGRAGSNINAGNVVNTHATESDLNNPTEIKGVYIWDPEYKRGDRYIPLATVSLDETEYEYTGKEIKPQITVNYGEISLTEGEDYTLSVDDNVDAGKGSVTVEGTGIYKKTKSVEFTIKAIDIDNVDIAPVKDQIHTGSEIEPQITLRYNGRKLSNGEDYTVTFKNNVSVGKAQIVITGKKNFTGSKTIDFNIIAEGSTAEEKPEIVSFDMTGDVPKILEEEYADVKDAVKLLPEQAEALLSSGETVKLGATWSCEDYDNTPSAANVYKWEIDTEGYEIIDGMEASGDVTIVNKGISSETIGVQDMTVEYCDTVEVAELFTIDDTAGEARYEIVKGGTGKGTIDGTKLTVEQPGTFIIKVTVEKEGQEALEAMATIEVGLPDIEEVRPPEITSDKLESYYEDAGAVIAVLPTKVAVSTDTGIKEMKIIWYCQSYDKRPNASNTFVWVIDPKEYAGYDMNGKEIYGEITFQNMMMLGDINSDGTVDLTDLMKCLYHVSGSATLSGEAFAAADVNEDGTVDLTDLMKILYYVSGSISEF